MKAKKIKIHEMSSEKEQAIRKSILQLYKNNPIPDSEILSNLGLFIRRQDFSRILFMNELYRKIVDIHGIIMEFGVRWGKNMALYEVLRGIYEPYNFNRRIIGFDTFEGFPSVDPKDGPSENVKISGMAVTDDYADYLEKILEYHENESPVGHIRKFELVKGDASIEIHKFLEENPETIIALAYFDFDIYKPTRDCLEAIRKHVAKGTVIGFDELNVHTWPGETIAFKEVFELDKCTIHRNLYSSVQSYIVL